MEITKTFSAAFPFVWRAKLRRFWGKSVFRYALGVALITWGIHGNDPTLTTGDKLLRGGVYLACVCAAVLGLQAVAAALIARRTPPRTITFKSDQLVVRVEGLRAGPEASPETRLGWEWIASASETPEELTLAVGQFPPLELFLSKSQLSAGELETLRNWLMKHGKLPRAGRG